MTERMGIHPPSEKRRTHPGLKAAAEMVGLYGGDPRPPWLPLGKAEREALALAYLAGTLSVTVGRGPSLR
jgi:hypothetical protein